MKIKRKLKYFSKELLQTPNEWCIDYELDLYSYDGWNNAINFGSIQLGKKSINEPINKLEFYQRCTVTTVNDLTKVYILRKELINEGKMK